MSKIVTLEFSALAIRAAEIKNYNTKKAKLVKVAQISLEPGAISESSVNDREVLVESLKTLFRENSFGTKEVAIVASGRRFTVRKHSTALTTLKDIKKMLPMEAPNSIPDIMNDPIYDFYPVHQYKSKGLIKTDGLVVSTPSEYIIDLVSIVAACDLKLEYIEYAPVAIQRWLTNNVPDADNYILLNIRDESSDVMIVKDKVPQSIRIVAIGLDSSKRKVGRHGINEISISMEDDGIRETPEKILLREIMMTVQAQEAEVINGMKNIFISGPRASDPGMEMLLKSALKVKVTPLYIEQMAGEVDEEQNLEPSFDEFVVMCGGIR